MSEGDRMEEKVYYIGEHRRYLRELNSRGLRRRNHIHVPLPEYVRGLSPDIEIINLGPIESTRDFVRELIAHGYKVKV